MIEAEGPERTWRRPRDLDVVRNQVAVGGRLVDVRTPSGVLDGLYLPQHGAHQGDNLALAVAATEAFFDRPLDGHLVGAALAELTLPGRFEVVGREPTVVLDGAHNPDGMATLATTLHDDLGPVPVTVVVLGLLRGRDPAAMVAALELGTHDVVIVTAPPSPRALPVAEVAAAVAAADLEVEVVADVGQAVERALGIATDEDRVVVTGSLYVVGAARAGLVGTGDR